MRSLFSSPPRLSVRGQSFALVFASALLLFAWGVWHSDLNREWLLAVHATDMGPANLWIFLTQWGDAAVVLLVLLVLGRASRQGAALVLKGFVIGSVVSPLLKMWWSVPRPLMAIDPLLLNPMGNPPGSANSMPSGHALAVSTLVCLIVLMYPLLLRRKALLLPLILGGLVVAFSRVVVGAHWPADVLAGLGLGIWIAWLAMQSEALLPWSSFLNTRLGNWLLLALEVGLVVYVVVTAPEQSAAMAAMLVAAVIGLLGAVGRYLGLRHQGASR
jgi:membrane-associated phospholipid phosphatase